MVNVKVQTPKDEQVTIAAAAAVDDRVLQAMETGLANALLQLVGIVQREYIQDGARTKGELGPGARIHSVTGRLRQGMQHSVKSGGNRITGTIGNNVKYAAYHEFGFHGTVNVRAHTRVTQQFSGELDLETDTRRAIRTRDGQFLGYKESRKASTKFQKTGFVAVQFVKAHARNVQYQGRPFVRPALAANETLIVSEISRQLQTITG